MKSVTWRDGYGRRDRPGELVVVVDSERDDAQRPPPLSIKVVAPEHDEISRAEDPLLGSDSPPSPSSPLVIGVPVLDGRREPSCIPSEWCGVAGWFVAASQPKARPRMLQLGILLAVMLQNSSYALLRAYSRGTLKETYSSSSVLLAMEVTKLVVSAYMVVTSSEPSDVPFGSPLSKYAHLLRRSLKMAVPAIIYLAMNLLSFVALARIDAATFSIAAQLKVLTTAAFSVALLGRSLHVRKWRALLTLTLGVVLISAETKPKVRSTLRKYSAQNSGAQFRARNSERHVSDAPPPRPPPPPQSSSISWSGEWAVGFGAVLAEVVLSGFASIYFERVLKSADEVYSVWDRNFQLAVWSIAIYTPMMLRDNPTAPFAGWSAVAAVCAAVGALGGVLVALCLKHADSVTKTIATTGAIVLTTLVNAAFLDGPMSLAVATGALLVVLSVFSFNDNGEQRDNC